MSYHYLIKRHDPSRGFPPFEHLETHQGFRPSHDVLHALPPGNYQAVLMGPDGRFRAARRFCVVPVMHRERHRSRFFPWMALTETHIKNTVVMDRWDHQPETPRPWDQLDAYRRD